MVIKLYRGLRLYLSKVNFLQTYIKRAYLVIVTKFIVN